MAVVEWLVQQCSEAAAPAGHAGVIGRQHRKRLQQIFAAGARGECAIALHAREQRFDRRIGTATEN